MRTTISSLALKYGIGSRDLNNAWGIVHGLEPDVVLAPGGNPYIYRWHIIPRNRYGNYYFHLQVADDPDRPLHDHPWDNQSVILAGGYLEYTSQGLRDRYVGMTIQRKAEEAHRLLLPSGVGYSMSLFSTGPHIREWGYHTRTGWVHNEEFRL